MINSLLRGAINVMRLPIIIYYVTSSLLLTYAFYEYMKLPYAIVYSWCIIFFNSALWELPLFLMTVEFGTSFATGLLYFIPLCVFVVAFNIKLDLSFELLMYWVVLYVIYLAFVTMLIPEFWSSLGIYSSIGYLSTFIPRTVTLFMLVLQCSPLPTGGRFNIWREY